MILFFSEDVDTPTVHADFKRVIHKILSDNNCDLEFINYIFCSDEFLLDINKKYLNHDYYTDIITFDYSEDSVESDIYISTDRVQENSKDNGVSFTEELHRIMIHGALHLAGFADKSENEKTIMTQKEDEYLTYLHF